VLPIYAEKDGQQRVSQACRRGRRNNVKPVHKREGRELLSRRICRREEHDLNALPLQTLPGVVPVDVETDLHTNGPSFERSKTQRFSCAEIKPEEFGTSPFDGVESRDDQLFLILGRLSDCAPHHANATCLPSGENAGVICSPA
jgi:hypothetical protein